MSATSSGPSSPSSTAFGSRSPRSAKLCQSWLMTVGVGEERAFPLFGPLDADLQRRAEDGVGDRVAGASRAPRGAGRRNQAGITIPSTIVR